MIPTHSNFGAMSPTDPHFTDLLCAAQEQIRAAVSAFEEATGRTVDGLSVEWIEVTSLCDSQPKYIRTPLLSWLPMPGEFD